MTNKEIDNYVENSFKILNEKRLFDTDTGNPHQTSVSYLDVVEVELGLMNLDEFLEHYKLAFLHTDIDDTISKSIDTVVEMGGRRYEIIVKTQIWND
tara:strand:- start:18 stop:308 length:291 start_codon:yes stop_codon:yes gene_type:complete